MPKHTLYISQPLYDSMDVISGDGEGLSARVATLCSIAIEGMREVMPALQVNEWKTLIDVSNGHVRNHDSGLAYMVQQFHFAVSKSGPECNARFGVDCLALARKLAGLTLLQQCAVMEVCRRFLVRSDITKQYGSDEERLLAIGAKVSPPVDSKGNAFRT